MLLNYAVKSGRVQNVLRPSRSLQHGVIQVFYRPQLILAPFSSKRLTCIHNTTQHRDRSHEWAKYISWILILIIVSTTYFLGWMRRRLTNLISLFLCQSHNARCATYSISQEICTRFCCALLCCGYAIVHNEFTWSIYPYSSGLLCWHWGNR